MKGSQMGVLAKVGSFKSERQAVLDEIERTGIIAILRGDLKSRAIEAVKTLGECGITAVEVTMNSPNAFETIRVLRQEIHVPFALGAGTVLTQDEVTKAFDSGARFVVSPNMSPAVITATKKLDMASFPGCSTCTEILEAFDHGADAVKIFPATIFSPESLRTIRSSLGNLRLIPTGGITPKSAAEYFAAGAWALGIGSALVNANDLRLGDALRSCAGEFVSAATARQGQR
jgi:2-dehydro-3-deoxyphosphogluconate aldolase / (4S)-4-hydroxy-2-oxoglutarate aldolase